MKTLEKINQEQLKKVPKLKPGDTVRVHAKIIEGNKERIQIFEGVVLRVKGGGTNTSFIVRKISFSVGVERTFLLHSPKISKIQVVKRARVRRAYLTYLRTLRGKKAKLREKQFDALAVNVEEEELRPEDLAPPAPSEEEIDQGITEIGKEALDVKEGQSTEKIAESEIKEGKTIPGTAETDESQVPEIEIEEGLALAEKDIEKKETHEGERAEKKSEEKIQ
jgi:large subunit ribosomal protein L19